MVTILAFIVLGGGGAFAALGKNTIGTPQLKKNAVKVGKIGPEAVKAGKLAKNAVATNRLREGVVSTGKLGNLAVTGAKIAPNAITDTTIANNAVNTAKISNNAVNQERVATNAIGAAQLKNLVTRTASVAVANLTSGLASVSCLGDEQIISVGTHWSVIDSELYTNYARISGNTAIGRGNNLTGLTHTFFVDAYCLST